MKTSRIYYCLLICLCLLSFRIQGFANRIPITWVDSLNEKDFSFKDNWSYPEGLYSDSLGQLKCDGLCPPEIDQMFDKQGIIIPDSMESYYALVDSSHLYHSIKSEAWTYEWAGSDYLNAKKQSDGSILGQTTCNASTHSSLNILLDTDSATAWISLHSVSDGEMQIFPLKEGQILLDKTLFSQGIIKAEFNFKFLADSSTSKDMYWKGLIYSKIED